MPSYAALVSCFSPSRRGASQVSIVCCVQAVGWRSRSKSRRSGPAHFRINVVNAEAQTRRGRCRGRLFALGDEARSVRCSVRPGFVEFETWTEKHTFVLPSFDAYYGPFERGGASTGNCWRPCPRQAGQAVREEMRQALNDTGGPIAIDVEHRIASGRRQR